MNNRGTEDHYEVRSAVGNTTLDIFPTSGRQYKQGIAHRRKNAPHSRLYKVNGRTGHKTRVR